jgi:WD40 repeat protein
MPTLNEVRMLKGHAAWVRALVISPDGRILVSASDDNTIKMWDLATGRPVRTLKGHTGPIRSIAFSPDGRRLASGSWDRTVKLWEGGIETED